MKRFDAHIRSVNAALQKAPEILQSVCVYAPIDVFDGVVNEYVKEV